jgi:hypothetical protein
MLVTTPLAVAALDVAAPPVTRSLSSMARNGWRRSVSLVASARRSAGQEREKGRERKGERESERERERERERESERERVFGV